MPIFGDSQVLADKGLSLKDKRGLFLGVMAELCAAVAYMHQQGMLHRDLKPENVFMTADMHVRLGDFGLSRMAQDGPQSMTLRVGSPAFMAPEVIMQEGVESGGSSGGNASTEASVTYDGAVDVYSLGIVISQMWSAVKPYTGMRVTSLVQFMMKIVRGTRPDAVCARPGDSLDTLDVHAYPPKLLELMKQCWHPVPAERPSVAEIGVRLGDPALLDLAAAAGSKAVGEEAASAAEVDSAAAGVTTPAFTKEFTMYYIDGVPRDMLVMNLLSLCGVLDGRTDLRLIGFDDIASEEMLQINPSGMLPLLVVSRPGAQALPPLMLSGVELCGQYLDGAFPGVFLPEAGGADVMLRFAAISMCVQIETCGMYAFMDTYKEIEDEATALQKGKRIVYTATGFFRGDLLMPWSALRENKMHHTLLMLECFTVLDAKVAQMRKADAGGAMPYTCGSAGPLLPDWKLYWHLKLTVRMGRNFITKFPALLAWFADFERVHADVAKLWPKTWTGEAPANKTIVDMHKVNEGIDRAFEMHQKQGSSSGGSGVRLSAPASSGPSGPA